MIKKFWLYGFIIVVVLLCFLWILRMNINTIPLLENVKFGSTPRQVTKQLGTYSDIQYDVAGTGKTAYTYKTTVLDAEATVTCYFLNNFRLVQASVVWDNYSDVLYDQVYDCLFYHYSSYKHFFVNKDTLNAPRAEFSIGIDNGVTGLVYSIYPTNDSLRVLCIDNS